MDNWGTRRGLRALEREILEALAARSDPAEVFERLRSLQQARESRGQERRFLAFWEKCCAVTGSEVVSRHGYQKPVAAHDLVAVLAEVTELIAAIESDGSQVVLISGSLLGLVRDGGPIAYDDDIDLAVLLRDDDLTARQRAEQWSRLRERLLADGRIDPEYEAFARLHARMFTSQGVAVDLFPAWVDDGRAFVFPHTFGTLGSSALRPVTSSHGLPVPADPSALLTSNYGPSWSVPNPVWTFDWKAARRRFGAVVTAWDDVVAERRRSTPSGRRLVLHCGALKTGSTAVQTTLHEGYAELTRTGILYPRAGLLADEPDVGVRHNRLIYTWGRDRAEFERILHALVEEIDASDAHTVILSAESWSRPQFRPQLEAVVHALRVRAGCTDVEAVIALRNRQEHARSLYREYTLRRRNALACNEFLATERGWFDPLASLANLRGVVDDVTVVPYAGSDTADGVLAHLGVPAAMRRPHGAAHNSSLGAAEIEARRVVNRVAPRARHLWPGLSDADLGGLGGSDARSPVEHIAAAPYRVDEGWRARFSTLSGWSPAQVDALLSWSPETGPDVADVAAPIESAVLHWARTTLVETRVFERATTDVEPGTGLDVRLRRIRVTEGPHGTRITGVALGVPSGTTLTLRAGDDQVPVSLTASGGPVRGPTFATVLPTGTPSAEVYVEDGSTRVRVGRVRPAWRPGGPEPR